MQNLILNSKPFELFISANQIQKAVKNLAQKITTDLALKQPLFLSVLNGSFMFTSDLLRLLQFPLHVSFVKLSSYEGTNTTGQVRHLIGLNEPLAGRTVVVVEDIVDTGTTIENVIKQLKALHVTDVRVAAMFFKPDACKKDLNLHYIGLEIPDKFVVGYGLDYNGLGRNLPDLYVLK
jgi:hypoxanthine phosphoribosyltransferase